MHLLSGRFLQYYYSISIILITGLISYITYSYWMISPLGNEDRLEWISRSTKILDNFSSEKAIEKLQENINQGDVKLANRNIILIEKDVKYISMHSTNKELYHDLSNSITVTKKSILDIISSSEISSIIGVMRPRIEKFKNYVVANNWRTLSRMANRLDARLNSNKDFSHTSLKRLRNRMNKSIKRMKFISAKSVLSNDNKIAINLKLDAMDTEIGLLEKYLLRLYRFSESYDDLKRSYLSWNKAIAPELSLIQVQGKRKHQQLFFLMLGTVFLMILTVMVSLPIYFSGLKSGRKILEKQIISMIKDHLIRTEDFNIEWGSSKFRQSLHKLYEYIHKRMSFGSMFQDSIPFPAVLFDSNLNVIWANKLFNEELGIDSDQISSTISWDQIRKFTNLGESDPVIEAARSELAGIYQVQFKSMLDGSKPNPYEMYVSPVEYAGQNRIMIILYPLNSLEETIADQAKSLIGPVSRSLDLLVADKFIEEVQEDIKGDFEIAGIDNIFSKFVSLNGHFMEQKNSLYKQIEEYENRYYDAIKLLNDVSDLVSERRMLSTTIMSLFKDAKDSIVDLSEIRSEVELLFRGTTNSSKKIISESDTLVDDNDKLLNIFDDTQATLCKVSDIRHSLKDLKIGFDEFRTRLYQSIDQLMIFGRNPEGVTDGIGVALSKIKIEGRTFEKELSSYSKIITNLDVVLSKIQLIIEGAPSFDKSELIKKFDFEHSQLDSYSFRASRLIQDGRSADDKSVTMIKQFYELLKMDDNRLSEMEELLHLSIEEDHQKSSLHST